MCCQNKMKVLAYTFCVLTILLIIVVIALPIILKNRIKSKYTDQTLPEIDNTNLWARFPGEIKSNTVHTFNILDYNENNSPKISDTLSLEEKILYDNFNLNEKNDKLTFDAKFQYKVSSQSKNESIKSLSLGMFEALETISNPTKYQKGINSLAYLLNKAFPNPELFIRQIVTYDWFNNLITDENFLSKIFNNVDKNKVDKILSDKEEYAEYSFKNIKGFYNWIKILALPEEIQKATWLSKTFDLDVEEIQSILGINSVLNSYFVNYNNVLSAKFKCENKICGKELLYRQLLTGDVLKLVGLEGGLPSLYKILDPEFFPFSKAPEMNLYFEEYKKKINKLNINFEDYSPNVEQLNLMLNSSFNTCLLASNNSVLFLALNKSDNSEKMQEIFKISKNVSNFMADYIYDYLPSVFLYQDFQDKNGTNHTIDPYAKAYATITQGVLGRTYKLLYDTDLFELILSDIVWESFLNKLKINNKNLKKLQPDEVCPLIMQRALDDGKKVLKVCSDPETAFSTPGTLLKWVKPYFCIKSGNDSNCDMSIINYLKTIIYVTDDEIKAIYDSNFLGGIIEENDQKLRDLFNCGIDNCTSEYFSKIQFWKGQISKNIPEPFEKSSTISTIFPELFPYPIEFSYFAEKLGETDDISEEEIDFLISLSPKSDNILSEENSKVLESKINLEKGYTLFLKGLTDEEYLKHNKTISILNNGYLFENEINTKYKNLYSVLEGNSDEDNKYLDFLSNGEFFENFKPRLKKTTGFNFGIDFPTGKNTTIEYDQYGFYGKQSNEREVLRKIISINDLPLLNIKKSEYNCLLNDYSLIESPTMNFQKLTGDKAFIDGYQYKADEEPIYFYDKISSRPLKFEYEDDSNFKDINCKLYELDKDDIANEINEEFDLKEKKAFLTQKLNKPYMISVGNNNLNQKIEGNIPEENYICVDPLTNMVIDSKINFVYSIYTRKYGNINPKIENDKVLPVFTYQRSFEVDIDSYKDYFPNVKRFYNFRRIFLIIGIALIIICAIISLWAFVTIHKTLVQEDIKKNTESPLINDTRDPTLMDNSQS